MTPLIAKGTAAMGANEGVYYFGPREIGCSLVVSGDLGSDTIPITYIGSDGSETTAYDAEGNELELSATNPAVPIYSACKIKATKGVTSNAVGVDIHGL